MICIEIATRAEALDLIDRNELVWPPDAEVDPIFGSQAWLKAWWRTLALPTDRLWALVLREDAKPLGAAFLYLSRQPWGPLTAQELRQVGWCTSEFSCLHLPSESGAVQTMFDTLAAQREWDVFSLTQLPKACGLRRRVIEETRARGWLWLEEPDLPCPYIEVRGEFQAFVQSRLKAKYRKEIRQGKMRLECLGHHCLELVRQTSDLGALLDQMSMLESRSWKGEQGTGLFSSPEKDRFYREIAASFLERGQLALHLQWLDDRLISFWFGFIAAGRYYAYNTAYDPDFRNFSPGRVSLHDLLEQCWALGLERFNFLRGDRPYKKLWTDTATQNINLLVFAPTVKGRLLYNWRVVYQRCLAAKRKMVGGPERPDFVLDPENPSLDPMEPPTE
jgi:hypothetical protein